MKEWLMIIKFRKDGKVNVCEYETEEIANEQAKIFSELHSNAIRFIQIAHVASFINPDDLKWVKFAYLNNA